MKSLKMKDISVILFREMVRDKVFLSLSSAAILLVLASLILNEMVVGQEIKATKDLGLSVLNLFSLFILIFLGITHVSRDVNNKTLYLLFSKPVSRWEYLLSSVVSILFSILTAIMVIILTIFILSFIQNEIWFLGLLKAGYLTLLEMLVLIVFALFFVLITSPQLAMFLTLLLYIIGHTTEQAVQIVEKSSNLVLKYIILIFHGLLPNLEFFNKKTEIIYNLEIPFSYVINATIYSITYSVLIFLFCMLVFKKKEI